MLSPTEYEAAYFAGERSGEAICSELRQEFPARSAYAAALEAAIKNPEESPWARILAPAAPDEDEDEAREIARRQEREEMRRQLEELEEEEAAHA